MTTEHTSSARQKPPKAVFLATSMVIFFLSLSAADSVGFVPNYIDGATPTTKSVALSDLPVLGDDTPVEQITSILPERLVIPSIDLDLPIQNPDTRDVAALDDLLQQGPARYVDSAKLGEPGNVLIFAHSSHLPIVHNQMFRAFNKIPDLKAGDLITVEGGGKSFRYSVTSVRRADASDATIDLSPTNGKKLTLVTCDTLTGKSARWILDADFVAQI